MLVLDGLTRRFKIAKMPVELLGHFFGSDGLTFRIESKLPKDVKITNARFDEEALCFKLILYSEEFDDIPKAFPIPEIEKDDILFRRIYEQNTKEET